MMSVEPTPTVAVILAGFPNETSPVSYTVNPLICPNRVPDVSIINNPLRICSLIFSSRISFLFNLAFKALFTCDFATIGLPSFLEKNEDSLIKSATSLN